LEGETVYRESFFLFGWTVALGGPNESLVKLVGLLLTEAETSDTEDKLGALVVLLEKRARAPVIEKLVRLEDLDSRGNPTAEVYPKLAALLVSWDSQISENQNSGHI
jgi:hypothetical protein